MGFGLTGSPKFGLILGPTGHVGSFFDVVMCHSETGAAVWVSCLGVLRKEE